jgi:hypothetical protein
MIEYDTTSGIADTLSCGSVLPLYTALSVALLLMLLLLLLLVSSSAASFSREQNLSNRQLCCVSTTMYIS